MWAMMEKFLIKSVFIKIAVVLKKGNQKITQFKLEYPNKLSGQYLNFQSYVDFGI